MPKASIIIPAYNAEAFIQAALESVFSQTFQDFECIVVDDGSTDGTARVVKSFSDTRLYYYCIEKSRGPARPRNFGIERATGEYIFLFDADDVMHPRKLELSIKAFQQYPSADLLFTNYCAINKYGAITIENQLEKYELLWKLLKTCERNGDVFLMQHADLYPILVAVNFIGTSSVGLRRSVLTDTDRFEESLSNSDDRLFWILFSKNHNGVFINIPLHSYRAQDLNISHRHFVDRGPSKIKALQIAKKQCNDSMLIKNINQQIANDYASLAYAYQQKAEHWAQIQSALVSVGYKPNVKAVKMLISGLYYWPMSWVKK